MGAVLGAEAEVAVQDVALLGAVLEEVPVAAVFVADVVRHLSHVM